MLRLALITSVAVLTAGLSGCAPVVIGTGVATGAAVIHDRRTAGTVIEDQEIYLRDLRIRDENPDLAKQSKIDITPYNLQVLLTGQAASDDVSRRFAALVAQIPRVRKVYNEVETAAEATWSESVDDTYLTSKVKLALFNIGIDDFDPTRVKVTSSRGVVYLMGLLTNEEANAVTEKVRFLSGVQRVVRLFEYIPSN